MSPNNRMGAGYLLIGASVVLLAVGVIAARRIVFPPQLFADTDTAPGRDGEPQDVVFLEEFARQIDRPERGPMRCRLVPSADRTDALDVELTNTGPRPLRFWHATFGLQYHVTTVLRAPDGQLVGHLRWAAFSSQAIRTDPDTGRPPSNTPVHTLAPGQTDRYAQPLSVLHEEMGTGVPPGRYAVQVVFEYDDLGGFPEPTPGIFARSNLVVVDVGPDWMRVVG